MAFGAAGKFLASYQAYFRRQAMGSVNHPVCSAFWDERTGFELAARDHFHPLNIKFYLTSGEGGILLNKVMQ